MARACVTGGAGFIGSHVVDSLAANGWEVLVIDDFSSGSESNISRALAGGRVSVEKASIGSEAARAAIASFAPKRIFHLAAQMNVRASVERPQFDAEVNVVGTINILEAARAAGTEAVLFASTGGAIYGEQVRFPADESHPIHPECPYGVSKRAGELYLDYFAKTYGLRTCALRFANVYGPRQNPKGEAGVIAIFAQRLFRGEPLRINGSGEQTRDFVFVGDVVDAMLRASESSPAGFSCFNVGTGKETSLLEMVEIMRKAWPRVRAAHHGEGFEVVHGPALAGEQMRSVVTAEKLSRELGWRPKVQFAEGLEQTLRSFRPAQ